MKSSKKPHLIFLGVLLLLLPTSLFFLFFFFSDSERSAFSCSYEMIDVSDSLRVEESAAAKNTLGVTARLKNNIRLLDKMVPMELEISDEAQLEAIKKMERISANQFDSAAVLRHNSIIASICSAERKCEDESLTKEEQRPHCEDFRQFRRDYFHYLLRKAKATDTVYVHSPTPTKPEPTPKPSKPKTYPVHITYPTGVTNPLVRIEPSVNVLMKVELLQTKLELPVGNYKIYLEDKEDDTIYCTTLTQGAEASVLGGINFRTSCE